MSNINGHEYVDLGLPSGLKWATCNIGANNPKDFGAYFAWGETEQKSSYSKSNSVTYGRSDLTDAGIVNADGNLTTEYDAATVLWGLDWRMPTSKDIQELVDNCTWTWDDEKRCYKVTGPNGKSIILPAAGCHDESGLGYAREYGRYWSSSAIDDYEDSACGLDFYADDFGKYFNDCRSNGQTIRPVSEK